MATDTADRPVLGEASLVELSESLRGEVLRPGEDAYEEARAFLWNAVHAERRPALVIRCHGAADVIAAVRFARSAGCEIAVRGGGHSLPGFSTVDGGIVIDLSPMRAVVVDPERRRAVAQGGCRWADVDNETQAFGLATTGGLVSTTGIAGFTLGGGIGWLMRKHGLASDNLVGADVVTADGRLVRASADQNPDLFWALRGGGGNFGIVTAFEFALHPVGPVVLGGPIFFRAERAAEILRFYRDWVRDLPDELTTLANVLRAPPAPFLPEDVHGQQLVAIISAYAGPVEEGERAVAALRELADPVADLLGPLPYTALQSLVDPLWPAGGRYGMRSGYLAELPDAAIDALVSGHAACPAPAAELHVHHLGGAVARVGAAESAFGNRSAPFLLNILAAWQNPAGDDDVQAWRRELHANLAAWDTGDAYANFMEAEGADRTRAAYGDTYGRLAEVKRSWDPDNVFHLNQNVLPAQP